MSTAVWTGTYAALLHDGVLDSPAVYVISSHDAVLYVEQAHHSCAASAHMDATEEVEA